MAGARPGLAERAETAASTAVEPRKDTVIDLLKKQTAQVELALPGHLKGNADAYVRSAITLIKQTPGLAKVDPLTILFISILSMNKSCRVIFAGVTAVVSIV